MRRILKLFRLIKNLQPTTYNLPHNRGFTLLELLVVISIIAILITFGIPSFTTVQKKGRDSKRKSDLRDVRNALEQYYSICGFQYPTPNGSFYNTVVCTTPGVTNIQIMPTVPSDPRASPYYCPTPAVNCTSGAYKLCASLESESTTEYCITNQQ